MRISFEGKWGIGLALLALLGAGAVMVWPNQIWIGWGLMFLATAGVFTLAAHHALVATNNHEVSGGRIAAALLIASPGIAFLAFVVFHFWSNVAPLFIAIIGSNAFWISALAIFCLALGNYWRNVRGWLLYKLQSRSPLGDQQRKLLIGALDFITVLILTGIIVELAIFVPKVRQQLHETDAKLVQIEASARKNSTAYEALITKLEARLAKANSDLRSLKASSQSTHTAKITQLEQENATLRASLRGIRPTLPTEFKYLYPKDTWKWSHVMRR